MSLRVSDLPALLAPGLHQMSMDRLNSIGVEAFPLSTSRRNIMDGFRRLTCDLIGLGIPGDLVVDGSFLTEEIEPDDLDFALCVTPEFFEACAPQQRKNLEWIRDDFSIKETHLCDCHLCVEYPTDHIEYFDGIQNRAFWVNLFAESKVYKRIRGVAIIALSDGIGTV